MKTITEEGKKHQKKLEFNLAKPFCEFTPQKSWDWNLKIYFLEFCLEYRWKTIFSHPLGCRIFGSSVSLVLSYQIYVCRSSIFHQYLLLINYFVTIKIEGSITTTPTSLQSIALEKFPLLAAASQSSLMGNIISMNEVSLLTFVSCLFLLIVVSLIA